ncbi:hypothetical protein R1sor_006784 [Riccia sorocarpa]|uniref:Transcription activator GCR1-like domain-containing protein n=1 Tax=Riccia sorocarpa TaxID=122646 RepID=A0ABD3HP11_9MARC
MAELGGANRLKHIMISEEDPTKLQLQRALPVLAERISIMHQDLSSKISGIDLKLSGQTKEIKRLGQHLEDILQGRTEMRLTARFDMGWSDTTQGTRNNLDSAVEATRAGVVEANRVGTDEEFPRKYKLSRGIATVSDLWREWTEGIGGGPAVKDLERNRGNIWCEGNERRFFNRRKCDRELLYELLCPYEVFKGSLRLDGPGYRADSELSLSAPFEQLKRRKRTCCTGVVFWKVNACTEEAIYFKE